MRKSLERFGRMAALGAGLSGALGHSPEAFGQEPEPSTKHEQSTEDNEQTREEREKDRERKERSNLLTEWASTLNVKKLHLEVFYNRNEPREEWLDVFIGDKRIGSISYGRDGQFSKETLIPYLQWFLEEQDILERGEPDEIGEGILADTITYQDAHTRDLMSIWGIKVTETEILTLKDSNPYNQAHGIVPDKNSNAVLSFSHIGEDTIVIGYVEKDGDRGEITIVNGSQK